MIMFWKSSEYSACVNWFYCRAATLNADQPYVTLCSDLNQSLWSMSYETCPTLVLSSAVTHGVPQGLVLHLLLFTLCIHRRGYIIRQVNLNLQCFADDTQIYLITKCIPSPPLYLSSMYRQSRSGWPTTVIKCILNPIERKLVQVSLHCDGTGMSLLPAVHNLSLPLGILFLLSW